MADNDVNEIKSKTNNVLLFRTAVTNCFKNIAECVSEEEFLDTMTILKSNPTLAKKLREVLVKELYEGMCAELDDILAQGDLAVGLDKAANLAQEALNCPDENLWRPPGDVKEHLRSLEAQAMVEESKLLENQIEKLNGENARMMKEITKKRAKVQAINDRTNRASKMVPVVLSKLEKTVEQLHELVKIAAPNKM